MRGSPPGGALQRAFFRVDVDVTTDGATIIWSEAELPRPFTFNRSQLLASLRSAMTE